MQITSTVAWNGSAASRNGLLWAIERERTHGGGILLLAIIDSSLRSFGPAAMSELTTAAGRALTAELDWVRQVHPEVPIESRLLVEDRERALTEEPPSGSMVVLGVEERAAKVKRWSLTARVVAKAPGSVAVVPARPTGARVGVVVATDGSESALAAMRVAADEARHRGEPLDVVHAWSPTGPAPDEDSASPGARAQERELLEEWTEQLRRDFPSVTIRAHLDLGPPVTALTRRASAARLLVVGSRGLGSARQLLLGSVSRSLILGTSRCPVIVVKT